MESVIDTRPKARIVAQTSIETLIELRCAAEVLTELSEEQDLTEICDALERRADASILGRSAMAKIAVGKIPSDSTVSASSTRRSSIEDNNPPPPPTQSPRLRLVRSKPAKLDSSLALNHEADKSAIERNSIVKITASKVAFNSTMPASSTRGSPSDDKDPPTPPPRVTRPCSARQNPAKAELSWAGDSNFGMRSDNTPFNPNLQKRKYVATNDPRSARFNIDQFLANNAVANSTAAPDDHLPRIPGMKKAEAELRRLRNSFTYSRSAEDSTNDDAGIATSTPETRDTDKSTNSLCDRSEMPKAWKANFPEFPESNIRGGSSHLALPMLVPQVPRLTGDRIVRVPKIKCKKDHIHWDACEHATETTLIWVAGIRKRKR